jgi:hypothetical protein
LTPLKCSPEEVDGGRKRRFDGGYNRSFENNNILSSDLQKSKDNTGFYMAEADDEKYSLKVFSSFQPKEMTKSPQPNFGNHQKKSAGVDRAMATDLPIQNSYAQRDQLYSIVNKQSARSKKTELTPG